MSGPSVLPDVEWPPTRPFWEGCRRRVLQMPRCVCGAYIWYPQPRCPACRSDAIQWVPVSGRATLFTWTTVYRSFIADMPAPYVTGLVELIEDPQLRLATLLRGVGSERLRLGMPLRVDFEVVRDGIVVPVFRP